MGKNFERRNQITILTLIAMSLFGIAFLTPDAAQHPGHFFTFAARSTSWRTPLDLASAWCSIKIILFSLGLFLVVDSIGTILTIRKQSGLAATVFSMQIFPGFGLLAGTYYVVKSLL